MWLPSHMPVHADALRQLGFELDPRAKVDPAAAPLGAIASLGHCSASFVSPNGLVITNHHCVTAMLQHNVTATANPVVEGMLAAARGDEPSAGPDARLYVTTRITDVTAAVMAGLERIEDPGERHDERERRGKQVIADCERADTRCSLSEAFGGSLVRLIEQRELRDLRLVYAPTAAIADFGGEVDNWMWPRHAGDFALLRAYVRPDGASADYDRANVPFPPAHYLRLATRPLRAGDMVWVAGYPGRTERL
jgi:hypothetical protein